MAKLSQISVKILEIMRQHPEGITEGEIRDILQIPGSKHVNFGRRRRELNYHYKIEKKQEGAKVLYVYKGPREAPLDTGQVGIKLRAQVLHAARGRCGSCGRSVDQHGIVLVVDHKIPREWGGPTVPENLWAICEECNAGKKNDFESVDADWMRDVMAHRSVHVRLGETLKAAGGQPVAAATLEFVANQDDWKKRIRELRYLGWQIKTFNRRVSEQGRVSSYYRLITSAPWPKNPTAEIRSYERERPARNRSRSSSKHSEG